MNREKALFLDRDGVVNVQIIDGYVQNRDQFVLKSDFIPAMKLLRPLFDRIVVVTNQQGIAKGLCTQEGVEDVHSYLRELLQQQDMYLDGIYYCPHLASAGCHCRKPDIGMAQQVVRDFPAIDFNESFMVGDSLSDMLFGRRCAMKTVFVGNPRLPKDEDVLTYASYVCIDLLDFVKLLNQ